MTIPTKNNYYKLKYIQGDIGQPLNIKTAVERPILKLGLPIFIWSFVGCGCKQAVVGGDLYFDLFIIKIKAQIFVYFYDQFAKNKTTFENH